jgi:uncharacterized membrane protein
VTIADIASRLESTKKLSRTERENIETALTNRYGSGDMGDEEYRVLNRTLHAHA